MDFDYNWDVAPFSGVYVYIAMAWERISSARLPGSSKRPSRKSSVNGSGDCVFSIHRARMVGLMMTPAFDHRLTQ